MHVSEHPCIHLQQFASMVQLLAVQTSFKSSSLINLPRWWCLNECILLQLFSPNLKQVCPKLWNSFETKLSQETQLLHVGHKVIFCQSINITVSSPSPFWYESLFWLLLFHIHATQVRGRRGSIKIEEDRQERGTAMQCSAVLQPNLEAAFLCKS